MAAVGGGRAGSLTDGGRMEPAYPGQCRGCRYEDPDGRGGVCAQFPAMKPPAVIAGDAGCPLRRPGTASGDGARARVPGSGPAGQGGALRALGEVLGR